MIELTISERIMKAILEIIIELLEFLAIDIEETLRSIVGDEKASQNLIRLLTSANQHVTDDLIKIKAA